MVYRTILPFSNFLLISKPTELVYKAFLGSTGAFLILKRYNERHLRFYNLSETSLKSGSPVRNRILKSLKIEIKDLDEVDIDRQMITVKKNATFQL